MPRKKGAKETLQGKDLGKVHTVLRHCGIRESTVWRSSLPNFMATC
jgi:hypothetical protein